MFGMTKRILCVDDEPNILAAFERQLRTRFDLEFVVGAEQALRTIEKGSEFAVVLSDLRMPGMNGIQLLSRVRQIAPDTVRMILTGNADLTAAIEAVNEGKIYQFLTKPCPAEMLARALNAALEQYRLITAERELLEQTVQGSIGLLIEILSLVNPVAFSRTYRIRHYMRHMAEQLQLADRWQYELAGTLSQIGCVAVPADTLEKSHLRDSLAAKERDILAAQGEVGRKLLAKIPRLEKVSQMIAQQRSAGPPTEGDTDQVAIGAHLLRIALDFDELVLQGMSLGEALLCMRRQRSYSPRYVDALRRLQVEDAVAQNRLLRLDQLRPGMVITEDLYSKTGLLLLAKGHEITESALARLDSFSSLFGIAEPISVTIPGTPEQAVNAESLDISDAVAHISSGLVLQHA